MQKCKKHSEFQIQDFYSSNLTCTQRGRHTPDLFCVLPMAPSGPMLKQSSASPTPPVKYQLEIITIPIHKKRTQDKCNYSISSSHKTRSTDASPSGLSKEGSQTHECNDCQQKRPCLTDSYLYPKDEMRGSKEP